LSSFKGREVYNTRAIDEVRKTQNNQKSHNPHVIIPQKEEAGIIVKKKCHQLPLFLTTMTTILEDI